MDLHRQDGVPEWETIQPDEWNEWQIRAHETNGWDTPGNRESLKGLIATTSGLYMLTRRSKLAKLLGVGLVGYGRYSDIKDGKKADATGTKSPLGESIDAGIDKVLIGFASASSIYTKAISTVEVTSIGVGQVANVVLTGIAKIRNREIHPGHAGKIGTFGLWAGIGSHSLANTLESFGADDLCKGFHKAGSVLTYAGVIVSGAGTVMDYIPAALGKNSHTDS
jgi:phosphatidylglycerophosphate synthase